MPMNLLDLEDIAREGKLSIHTVRAWRRQRRFPVVKLGRRVLVLREDWEKFVRSGLVEAVPTPASVRPDNGGGLPEAR
jgi:hypothetical protein